MGIAATRIMVSVPSHELDPDMLDWCDRTLGQRGILWGATQVRQFCWEFTFVRADHAILFKLTWC